MKIRNSFVSNSSSSSFIIDKEHLTSLQESLIKNHWEIGKILDQYVSSFEEFIEERDISNFVYCEFDEWKIDETEDSISGYTSMDNFDMRFFMSLIGVDTFKAKWE